jgi:hypothetical protein
MAEFGRSALRRRLAVLSATEALYQRYPVAERELSARRKLTLQALRRDIHEVAWIERTTSNLLLRDWRVVAWLGRFSDPRSDELQWLAPGQLAQD